MTKTRSQMAGKSLLSEIPRFPKRTISSKKHQTKPKTITTKKKTITTTKKQNPTKKKHLPYARMIRETLTTMSNTSTTASKAVSGYAIARYLTSHFGVEVVNQTHLAKVLQQGVESGALKQVTRRSFLLTSNSTTFGVATPTKKRLPQPTAPQQKKRKRSTTTKTSTHPPTPTPTPAPTPTPTSTPTPTPTARPLSQELEGKFEMRIEDFKRKQKEAAIHPHLVTEPFSLAGHTWSLLIFPLGNHRPSHLSVYIVPEGAPVRREVEMMRLSFKGKEREVSKRTQVTFLPGEGGRGMTPKDWGFHKFVELGKLEEGEWLGEGGFTVVVEMKLKQ